MTALVVVTLTALPGRPSSAQVGLPTLPEIPLLQNELVLPLIGDIPGIPSGGAESFRNLYGFQGTRFLDRDLTGQVSVITTTVTAGATANGGWTALGLLRNASTEAVGRATVRATLKSGLGLVLGTATADAMVTDLRPGEPAPFRLESPVAASLVQSVEWTVLTTASQDVAGRRLRIESFMEDPQGVRTSRGLWPDPPACPCPYAHMGGITNEGPRTAAAPVVIQGWLDAGRLVAVVTSQTRRIGGGDASSIAPGESLDFFVVSDDAALSAENLARYETILWGVAK